MTGRPIARLAAAILLFLPVVGSMLAAPTAGASVHQTTAATMHTETRPALRSAEPLSPSTEPGWSTLDDDYHHLNPQLSDSQIADRRASLAQSAILTEKFAKYPGYAGAQLNMDTGRYVIAATNDTTLAQMDDYAVSVGLEPELLHATYTFDELERSFNKAGGLVQGIKGADASLDIMHNAFVVTLPSTATDLVRKVVGDIPGAVITYNDKLAQELVPYDGSCISRKSCGYPVRGGISVGS